MIKLIPLIRIGYRAVLLILLIILGSLLTLILPRGTMPRRGLTSHITCWWHRRVLQILGIKVNSYGTAANSATLFVANHLSWLDIHLIGSRLPVRFLSKAEVKDWPVFGWLASRAGTLYIPRGTKSASANAIRIMQQTLRDDQHVALFPEGTTSDGNIKRFHGRLMQSAIDAECLIQPVAIQYPDSKGNPVDTAVLYTGDTTFMESVKNVMAAKNLTAELHFLEPINPQNMNPVELASYTEERIKKIVRKGREKGKNK
ncbi:MAG: lysophospholipid acyltransferase family protein [Gammaproteobacteria bacterium]|nr:lysophospholipid acyltransferase family protein [Gammaproteobacteria bacterium]